MIVLVVILVWLVVGFASGLYEARRGHWRWLWLLGAMAGPLAIPLSRQIEDNERLARPIVVSAGSGRGPGGLRVLAGIDGSTGSIDAARRSADLLGDGLGELTLAHVTDFDIHEAVPGPVDADHAAVAGPRQTLEEAASRLAGEVGFTPATVLLSGPPAETLEDYATAEGFGMIVIASRGHGMTKRLLGSCAERLAGGSTVPVLVLPTS